MKGRQSFLTCRLVALGSIAITAGFSIAIVLLALFAVMPNFGDQWWFADLFSHFRFHYLLFGALTVIFAILLGRWRTSAAVFVLLVPHVISINAPDYASEAAQEPRQDQRLRVLSINLQWNNRTPDKAISLIRDSDADIVLVQEATRRWHSRIASLLSTFPHIAPTNWRQEPQNILLSRFPINSSKIHPGRQPTFNFLTARVIAKTGVITVVGVHPPYPMSARLFLLQQDELNGIARVARVAKTPVIVAGDFNLTPYSLRFRHLLSKGDLRFVSQGWRWPRTWPTRSRLGLPAGFTPGIPIDSILVSEGIRVLSFRRGPAIGSDHFPVFADLVLPRSPAPQRAAKQPSSDN